MHLEVKDVLEQYLLIAVQDLKCLANGTLLLGERRRHRRVRVRTGRWVAACHLDLVEELGRHLEAGLHLVQPVRRQHSINNFDKVKLAIGSITF